MKLIESPINNNLNLEKMFPTLTDDLFKGKALNFVKNYALDSTKVIYADSFDKISIVLANTKRKIRHQEIETIIHRLFGTTRENIDVTVNYKEHLLANGAKFPARYKDVILLEKVNAKVG
jgi:hypothetical protein